MRNIRQYPVTKAEKIEVLTRLAETILAEGRIGDVRPLVLSLVIKDIEGLPDDPPV